ncbi:preprotein translocase subunit SecA [Histidinibacterium aquaticum]|uniref:Preprotein translocase subunit SecA n=2 Tax=Histidinibacterium aquaticum TaxID=2613962 RepID=A0A5J5GPR6_9RHOB|nr:preprotein translocase subunit SecA [Histidinibacterium aquaticum]
MLDEHLTWRLIRPPRISPALKAGVREVWTELRDLDDASFEDSLRAAPFRAESLLRRRGGASAIAHVLEVMRRETGLALRDNQIDCAISLLQGTCVELRTGEGKTLAAGLAALAAARSRVSVHVVTVNDYLARRDSELIAPIAARLGLRVAVITQEMPDQDKRRAYDADIVYGANKTFVFDHLRDRRGTARDPHAVPRQMGQAIAIVDEIDSVLADDATTPMILSEPGGALPVQEGELFHALHRFASGLAAPSDIVRDGRGAWRLTDVGLHRLEDAASRWRHPLAGSEDIVSLAETALSAIHMFREGEAYVIRDGKVQMIDQSTGRLMPDRRWGYGLHQLIEIDAGLEPTEEMHTVAQITQQTYFRQYRILSGLTGTGRECSGEFWAIYRLPVRRIAPHAPPRLRSVGRRMLPDRAAKWTHIVRRACDIAQERSVLVGLNDVSEVAELAGVFRAAGREVAVLDALTEAQEAEIVAEAGQPGQITLATHLAGRGTDIGLAPAVREAGGLHVVIGSFMVSGRMERQLFGRAGRQGDPGSYERAFSREDRAIREGTPTLVWRTLRAFLRVPGLRWPILAALHRRRDAVARKARRETLLREQNLARTIGYG